MKQDSGKQRRGGGPDKGRMSIRIMGQIQARKYEETDPSKTLMPLYHTMKHTHSGSRQQSPYLLQ
jgi:hypothetical protein